MRTIRLITLVVFPYLVVSIASPQGPPVSNTNPPQAGQGSAEPLASPQVVEQLLQDRERPISPAQLEAARSIIACDDKMQGLEGVAGSGKTWGTLSVVRDAAAEAGFSVQGLAPTGTASNQLAEAGIPAMTLQRFLGRTREDIQEKTLFVVDESSLVSTRMANEFLKRLGRDDRVLFVGGIPSTRPSRPEYHSSSFRRQACTPRGLRRSFGRRIPS